MIRNNVTSVCHLVVCDTWFVVVAGIAIQTSTNTVDLRGQRSSVAMMALEDAMGELYSLGTIYVVHGVGTGQIRKEVHDYLKRDAYVKSFHLEENSNGGCTVVHMK